MRRSYNSPKVFVQTSDKIHMKKFLIFDQISSLSLLSESHDPDGPCDQFFLNTDGTWDDGIDDTKIILPNRAAVLDLYKKYVKSKNGILEFEVIDHSKFPFSCQSRFTADDDDGLQ